jgi:hypothetical protein
MKTFETPLINRSSFASIAENFATTQTPNVKFVTGYTF